MDYGMIGKIEKAKRYAQQPERITFLSFNADFKGDNSTYHICLGPEGWDCSCSGFRTHGICPHVMALEKLFKPMLKRHPLPYAPGQNVVSDVEKAKRYAEEPDRIQFKGFEVNFEGENSTHHTTFHGDGWNCNCSFFTSRGVCSHTMAMERVLKGMMTNPTAAVTE
ncbi:MAG TPA: SWIM zinc finger family protein [Phototrophicaceae bacterium]|nr:SWIM zinc finger family protein [Phototrophicaceae bacterium]